MKIKVSEASGVVLDWLVAKSQGFDVWHNAIRNGHIMHGFWVSGYYPVDLNSWLPIDSYKPSTNWAQGGPIIEREEIELRVLPNSFTESEHLNFLDGDSWEANIWPADRDAIACCGTSPLIAALRSFCVSRLGEVVEVPEELCQQQSN